MLPLDFTRRIDIANVKPMGLLTVAACNRSINLASGFCDLMRHRNFTCAASLIRLQVDSALRLFAGSLVDDEDAFALKVFGGTPVKALKDRAGKLMNDPYLISRLSDKVQSVGVLYGDASNYIHFSESHCRAVLQRSATDTDRAHVYIGTGDKGIDDDTYLRAIRNFRSATNMFLLVAGEWVSAKYGGFSVRAIPDE